MPRNDMEKRWMGAQQTSANDEMATKVRCATPHSHTPRHAVLHHRRRRRHQHHHNHRRSRSRSRNGTVAPHRLITTTPLHPAPKVKQIDVKMGQMSAAIVQLTSKMDQVVATINQMDKKMDARLPGLARLGRQ